MQEVMMQAGEFKAEDEVSSVSLCLVTVPLVQAISPRSHHNFFPKGNELVPWFAILMPISGATQAIVTN